MRSEATVFEREKTKPYRLVKYFTFASLVVVFIGALILSVLFTHFMRTINRTKSENYANLLIVNLNHQVFMNYSIPVAWKYGGPALRNEEQFKLMDKVVRDALQGYNVEMVRIYTKKNLISYSYDTDEVGAKSVSSTTFKKAADDGEVSFKLIQRGSFWGILLGMPKEVKMVTTAPFRPPKANFTYVKGKGLVFAPLHEGDSTQDSQESTILGVFEVVRDLTEDYRKVFEFQKLMLLSITGVMAVLFITLRLMVKKGEAVLERRALEQLELKERLSRAERLSALGELTAGVSHEIRNPLGIIQSSAELLRKKMSAYEPDNPVANIIVEESDRLNTIITDFLNFAVPKEPDLLPTDMKEVVEKNLVFLDQQIRESHIIVSKSFAPDLPMVMADQGLLYQAFLNILINAMQGMGASGRIIVEIAAQKKTVMVSFKDTGKGIPEHVLGKVWDPFFTTKETGSGLGLGIVRNIIKSHGGNVSINNRPGGGAVVTVTLPVREGKPNGNGTDC